MIAALRRVAPAVRGIVIGSVLAAGMATATAAPDWPAAEAQVRARLAAQHADVIDVQAMTDPPLGTAFWVRTREAGGPTGHLVVVRGAAVYDARSDETISAILEADRALASHAISATGLLNLVRELGSVPSPLGTPIQGSPDAALNPRLTFANDHAVFVVHAARDVRIPEAPAVPKAYFRRATLTIASDYGLRWTVENIERPAR